MEKIEKIEQISKFLIKKKRIWKSKKMGYLLVLPKKWIDSFKVKSVEMSFNPATRIIEIKELNEELPKKRTGFYKNIIEI